uniref:Uncharacterized protein n=1 Tax=Strongyloides stercoralis TaxID=6248 RepID=A0A0K0EGV6_STRER
MKVKQTFVAFTQEGLAILNKSFKYACRKKGKVSNLFESKVLLHNPYKCIGMVGEWKVYSLLLISLFDCRADLSIQ